MPLTLEVNSKFERAKDVFETSGETLMITPPLDEEYWIFRVKLAKKQAIVAFPKFGTIGCGFAQERDWNTNLPILCDAEKIYNHIKHNKRHTSISKEDCLAAIRMIQAVAVPLLQKEQANGCEQEFRELLENAWSRYVEQNGMVTITHRRHVDYFSMSDLEFLKYRGLIE